jgi:hypothetical protein
MVTPIPIAEPSAELRHMRGSFRGYALGFGVADYRGRMRLQHSGGLPGLVSLVTMIPVQKLGIAVLTNQESGYAYSALTLRILDDFLGAPRVDYLGIYSRLRDAERAGVTSVERAAVTSRDSTSGPSLPLAKYAGRYADRWYGEISIAHEQGKLVMRFSRTPSLVGDLVHWQHDTFVARWRDRELRADAFVTFALQPDGSVDRVKMAAVSPATDFSFDFQDLLLEPVRAP